MPGSSCFMALDALLRSSVAQPLSYSAESNNMCGPLLSAESCLRCVVSSALVSSA